MPPLLYRPALLYLGCYLAAQVSFCELFRLLEKHQPDPELRWKECVRVKRGVADTAKPGGMYKDQIYFMGAISVLKNRHKLNFTELHCGKINVEDCLKLSEKGQISTHDKLKMPAFISDMKLYMRCLDHIAQVNEIK